MKYTLIDEKGPYALILRGERMTQYAVVSGLDKEAGSWDWTCCYYDFGTLSGMTSVGLLPNAHQRKAYSLGQNERDRYRSERWSD